MQLSVFRLLGIGAAMVGALAAQPAAASVTFNALTDTFGVNYDISSLGPLNRVQFRYSTNGGNTDDVHVELFSGQSGAGSNLFSGTLTNLTNSDFTQPGVLDGVFSAVLSYTGTQLPQSGPPPGPGLEPPRAFFLNLTTRGRDANFVNSLWLDASGTFQATTVTATVPEPGTLGMTALAGVLLLASRRRARRI